MTNHSRLQNEISRGDTDALRRWRAEQKRKGSYFETLADVFWRDLLELQETLVTRIIPQRVTQALYRILKPSTSVLFTAKVETEDTLEGLTQLIITPRAAWNDGYTPMDELPITSMARRWPNTKIDHETIEDVIRSVLIKYPGHLRVCLMEVERTLRAQHDPRKILDIYGLRKGSDPSSRRFQIQYVVEDKVLCTPHIPIADHVDLFNYDSLVQRMTETVLRS